MKFKALILDHDDTAVDSTATIHYPAHLEVVRLLRPDQKPVSLDGWFMKNFHPGIMEYLVDELEFTEDEIQKEYDIWREFTTSRIPHFYDGLIEALHAYRLRGGRVAVVSHSEKALIERDYASHDGSVQFIPDLIFGWHNDIEKRKPSLYPVREILQAFSLDPQEVLIVDDLKPGVVMAQAAQIPVVAAGWGHRIPEIERFMRENCVAYLESVRDFALFINI